MSFSAAKAVTAVGKKVFSQSRQTIVSSTLVRSFLCVQKETQMTRTFARSMWYLSSSPTSGGPGSGFHFCQSADNLGSAVTRLRWPSVSQTCNCGHHARLHTEGDKILSKFLEKEIKLEKDGIYSPEKVPGFTLSTDGAVATLSKETDGERVAVKFNVNHSVEAEPTMDEDGAQDESGAPQMRSYPDFIVEISKDKRSVLSIKCHYTETDLDEEELQEGVEEEDFKDFFLIDEVSIHSGTPDETTYCVGSEVMDGALYDMLITMLNERGIDSEFADKLSDVASAVEHGHYINFLEELKEIVDC